MPKFSKSTLGAACLWIFAALAHAADPPAPAVDFRRDVLPVLSDHCFQCHGPDGAARKADLRLDRKESALRAKEAVIVPGQSAESELIARITSHDPDEVMPPPRVGKPLSPTQVETLKRWVDSGAAWAGHWAFEPVASPPPPKLSAEDEPGVRNPIDRFVVARLRAEGLAPSPEADRPTLIRRATLALTGLPPTPAEVDAFLADSSPNAYETLVDRLLKSPRYGERMATDWLDQARYADTNGYQNDFARTMWPWRDWVIKAFNANMPFDRFVTEQLAGDLLPSPTTDQRIATGFNRNNRTVTEAGSIEEEWRIENAVDRVETTATVFLGLTMGCARCHDHKFDPVTQKEFYAFLGFFNSVNEKGVYTETRGNVAPILSLATPDQAAALSKLEAAAASAEQTAKNVAAALAGLPKTDADRAKTFNAQKTAADELAKVLRREKDAFGQTIPTVMVMEETPKPRPTYLLKRGRYDLPDTSQAVEPGVPSCLPPLGADAPKNRLGLARWLISPGHPLTARVTVNRIWQLQFGNPLVKTSENFGLQSDTPSHPELLDWLADAFVKSGWDLKALNRLIVTSATFRQSSRASAALTQRDPENRLLGRGPRYRLPAETVRDNALAVAGLLSDKIGGPSVKPYQPAGLWEELAGGAGEAPYVQDKAPDLYRRSLYVYRKRTVPHPAMANFDAPSRETCQVKRPRTNTPLQALELLNDVTYVEAARQLAAKSIAEGGQTPDQRLSYAFRRATARVPSSGELGVLRRGLERYQALYAADRASADKLVRQGDSPVPQGVDVAELASYTASAGVILNLDETITLE